MRRLREWWLDRRTDRMARRPQGRGARSVYGAPDAHSFAWEPVLDALQLERDDVLLDVGCGGGSFLRRTLEIVGSAAGVDHSRDMVRVATSQNEAAVREDRLRVVHADAHELPFGDGEFTAVSCIVAFLFFAEPARALREMRRVLHRERGRVAVFTVPPELRGTPAAPEPVATRACFYADIELQELGRAAGFAEVAVERVQRGAQLLVARG